MESPNQAAPSPAYPGFSELLKGLADDSVGERQRMERALIRLNRWRQRLLVNTYRSRQGNAIHAGPFKGMHYTLATEGATLPRLIGCYEAELQPTLMAMSRVGYQRVIDISCAEGDYAVGLARLFPDCEIHAHDISEAAQRACRGLAAVNHVQDQVQVAGMFHASGLAQSIAERFSASHEIEWIWQSTSIRRDLPDWVAYLSHLDQILWRESTQHLQSFKKAGRTTIP